MRKVSGSLQTSIDPGMSEWGNPACGKPDDLSTEYIGRERRTWGSEPSQYPQEKKTTVIPEVAASEPGGAQTSYV